MRNSSYKEGHKFNVEINENIFVRKKEVYTLKIADNTTLGPQYFTLNENEMLEVAKCINKKFEHESIKKEIFDFYESKLNDLNSGRDYLMQVEPSEITPSDTLEAFGFGRDGLGRT